MDRPIVYLNRSRAIRTRWCWEFAPRHHRRVGGLIGEEQRFWWVIRVEKAAASTAAGPPTTTGSVGDLSFPFVVALVDAVAVIFGR